MNTLKKCGQSFNIYKHANCEWKNWSTLLLSSCVEVCKISYKIKKAYDENQSAENLLNILKNRLIPEINIRFERHLLTCAAREVWKL